MSYTTREIADAVEKLVRTSIRRTHGTLGNREVGVTFNDYQDAAAGTFILQQNAPFYLIYLATRNLAKALELQRDVIAEFITIVEATDRRVTPISNLSPLANARVALDGMLLAAASRTKSFDSIEDVPAYQRFESNTQQFLDESSKNVRQDGQIVRTPGEARGLLASYYDTLREAHEDVIRRVELLVGATDDFNALDLPATLVQAILENSRDSIQGWYTQLQDMTEGDRLQVIRAATLDILAARSTVAGFGSLTGATMFVTLDGDGGVFADGTHEATPAEVGSTELGPYAVLEESPLLHIDLEGDSTTVEVQGSFVAALEATVYGPYSIGHPTVVGGVFNNELRIQLLNYTSWGSVDTFDVTFPASSGIVLEAWEAAGIINYFIPIAATNYPLICEPYPNPLKFGGPCDITWDGGNSLFEIESINPSTDFSALGIIERAYILVPPQSPASLSQNSIYRVRMGGVGSTILECDLIFNPDGLSGAALDETDIDVRITDDELPIRLRLTGAGDKAARYDYGGASWTHDAKVDEREDSLNNKVGIRVPVEGFNTYSAFIVGDIDLGAITYPGDLTNNTLAIAVDSGIEQAVILALIINNPTELITLLNGILAGLTVSVYDVYILFTSDGSGPTSNLRVISGDFLDDIFTAGEAGGPYEDLGITAAESQFNAATYLGFYPGSEVLCRRTTAAVIVDNVTDSTAAAIDGVARVEAEEYFSATHYSGRGRTDPFNILQLVASLFEATRVTATSLGGNAYSFAAIGAAAAGVDTTSILAIRASSDVDDIGLYALVTLVSDTEVQVTFSQALQGVLTDIDIEIGPDLTVPTELAHDAIAVVSNSPMNDGRYGVLDSGSVPFELELDTTLPFPSGNANLPLYFDLEVGYYGVTFQSTDVTLDTEITIDDNGGDPTSVADRFFSSLPAAGVGATPYWQLPEWSKDLNEGDLLELYPTQFDSPASSTIIVSTEESNLLVELASELATDTSQYTFTVGSPVPFARIRNSRMNNYATLKASLEIWLRLDVNQEAYFIELRRLLNPLAVNTNPRADQVNDAITQLELLNTKVVELEGLLEAYSADVVPQIDVMLTSLQEKGGDRARDLLLEAQFSTFFGLNMDEMSYSGVVQARLKEINREDLPVRKDNRTGLNAGKEELIGSYDETDYEYDISDLDEAAELDIPAGTTF